MARMLIALVHIATHLLAGTQMNFVRNLTY